MKKSQLSFSIKILSVILIISILFSSCASGVSTKKVKLSAVNTVNPSYSGDEYHKSNTESMKSVCKSGLIELLFDEKTMTPSIRDTNSGTVWSSLPQSSVSKEIFGSAVEVTLSNGGEEVYVLNSQDNSVNFSCASYTISENGVSVKYAMAPDAQTAGADITALTDKQIRVDLTVIYTLRDGSFYVNLSMNDLFVPDGVFIEKISLLNTFGAYEQSGADDYIFVPDGSGALIMTGVEDKDFKPVTLSVYGEDSSESNSRNASQCLFGAFGIKRNSSAFVCIIEQGDTIAQINACRNTDTTLNSVGASFKTTGIFIDDSGKKIKKTYGDQYKNDIVLCYRFLSGKSATYSGMATACRENYIRNSMLSTKTVEPESKNLPLVISLQGGYVNGIGQYSVLTGYNQALSLMKLLKAKGVNNAYLRYNGLYDNANNGTADGGSFKKALGKEQDYKALYDYLSSQNISLFIDTDILTYSYKSSGNAKALSSSNIKAVPSADDAFPLATDNQSFIKLKLLEGRIDDILSSSADKSFDGYSLNDAGAYLYSDYSSSFYSRESSKKEIASLLPVLASSKKLMIDTGNIYAVKNADVVSSIPMAPYAADESDAYVGIPFIQMLLHGITEYSAAGMNTYGDTAAAFLKSVEYGCLPCVEWYGAVYDETLDEKYYYDKNINDIVKYYTKANSALSDLRGARMTAHYKVQDGVYCTEYNNSSRVYVNYNDAPVTFNGITVNALDCVEIQ